jgi:hypothetical protein
MSMTNSARPERGTEELAEDEGTWTLVPDELSETGWACVFADGSFCRDWRPETTA